MSTTSISTFLLIISATIFVDVFYVVNAINTLKPNNVENNPVQVIPKTLSSSTQFPNVGQQFRTTPNSRKKWIQQNNLWIRNEQAQSGRNNSPSISSSTTTSKPPLNRGNTYTILKNKPEIVQINNRQKDLPKTLNYAEALGSNLKASTLSSLVTPIPKQFSSTLGPNKNEEIENLDHNKVINPAVSSNNNNGVTDEELREFSENLLKKDNNNAMKFITLNLQGTTISRSTNDEAPLPLMTVSKDAYKIPSIEKILLLYNNYFLDASQNEVYTGQERIEEGNFIDEILASPLMQFTRSFLIQKGKLGKDPKEFKDLLRQIWFNMYSRGNGKIGSSGFEHVFVGEIKNNQVSGLHNWLYFNEEESQKRANYLGYMKKIDLGQKGVILKYHFTFHDIDKPVGSMFIGTSPELEIALYTACFVLRADQICPLKMNGNKFIIRTFTFRYRGKNMIGSAFPEI